MHRSTFTSAPTARLAAAMGVVVLLAACGSPGSSDSGSGTATSTTASDLAVCEAVPGDALVALVDDQNLQNPDNIVPAVNGAAAADDPELVTLLNTVSAVLDTDGLVALNKAVDIDRQTSAQAAQAFVEEQGLAATEQVGEGRSVVVGSPNFSEGATLANLYAEVLNSAGYDASTQDVGNRELYLTDLESGSVTVLPEYVSTLTEFLNVKVNGEGAESVATPDLDATMTELTTLAEGVGLVVGEPADAQDQNAFAVTEAFATEHDLTTLTDLAENCGGIVLGGPPECPERPFCQLGLQDTYGLDVAEFTSLDAGGPLTKEALKSGTITLGLIFSSDAVLG
ncbi:glycine betaine ABC transporter substrate-binding protein [Sanguibacter antarcticus]|uniref:Osmoprotectant transport system substrate-binding protein n=1 Tax=Sanguibacter antarcticus TaxID=372484 RepID=A0A2A9E8W1_9MICO|nr:glycine betaine ABC transporter substrate-binding protein [Sanguibacter antarcticus]PFG34659.1 osmoprotectant transport system substrate-binding protein [Sanguibacter antarcticus]